MKDLEVFGRELVDGSFVGLLRILRIFWTFELSFLDLCWHLSGDCTVENPICFWDLGLER